MQSQLDPFVVRAHHAKPLWMMQYIGLSPAAVVEEVRKISSRPWYRLSGYWEDVWGKTPESSATVGRAFEAYFQTFADLPPHYPVVFSATSKDGLCAASAIGQHCNTFRRNSDGDAEWLNGLIKAADVLGLMAQISVTWNTKLPIVGVQRRSVVPTAIAMPASVARALVSERLFPVWAVPDWALLNRPLCRLWVRWHEHTKRHRGRA